MAPFEIILVPALSDNYIYIAHDSSNKTTMVVDPSEAPPVKAELEARGWDLTHILNTHHHGDHIGGNQELISTYNPVLIGPRSENKRIPKMNQLVANGDDIDIGGHKGKVLETPGHTHGHIAVWFPESNALFCGDTLFALGCGRVFEGTMEQMWNSLKILRALPSTAKVYCGHEYTLSNAKFAISIDPNNNKLKKRIRVFEEMRSKGEPTVPTLLMDELDTNPFLRADDPALATAVNLNGADPVKVFSEIRKRKDNF
ncbi:MAG: hydroxyacylglutathione hydrolase [Rhodospirillaceae bacterium]|nr:hydroxyacylglutathione hydrolase [Rhodospirillaceae bacterium]